MTRDEKIQKYINNLSRDDILREMKEAVWEWDIATLVDAAFGPIEESMMDLSDSELNDEYYEWFSYRFEDEKFDDDKEEVLELKPCSCDIHQLMRGEGHNVGCSER